jgi:hypothetical protein
LTEIASVIAGTTILLGLMLCFFRCYNQILKRGYYWYTAFLGCGLGLGAGFGVAFVTAGLRSTFVAFALVEGVSSGVIACFLPALFPIRSKRRAGPRRRLWKRTQVILYGFAGACGAAAMIMGWWAVLHPNSIHERLGIDEPGMDIMFLLLLGGVGLSWGWSVGKIASVGRDLGDLMKKDLRPPVLYLREFGDERRPFASRLAGEGPEWARKLRESSVYSWFPGLTLCFEDYMTQAAEAALGPLVALGSPDDYLNPRGAARDYAGDGDWRERFLQLAVSAQAILVSPSSSDSLRWELGSLLRGGMATKLFVVLGPNAFEPPAGPTPMISGGRVFRHGNLTVKIGPSAGPPARATSGVAALQWVRRFTGFPEWRPLNWEEFRRTMTELGYELPKDPRPSSVIAFDERAHPVLLGGRFFTPQEYVAAIKRYITPMTPVSKLSDLFSWDPKFGVR